MNRTIRGLSPLFVIVTVIILMVLLPSAIIAARLLQPATESWEHIRTYLLKDYIMNSLVLSGSVAVVTAVLGTFFAWALSKYSWGGSRIWEVLLFLPMAVPPYIGGYVYGGILNHFGTLDRILMSASLEPIRIDVLSMGGAVFVFSLYLMPYVMLVTRSFFNRLPKNMEESSRLLGKGQVATFFRVILPMGRSAVIGGVILVILEVLNDYGLVKYFGVQTFSTAIYSTWFGMSDPDGAVRLAASLMAIVAVLLIVEQLSAGRRQSSQARALSGRSNKKKAPMGFRITFYSIGGLYILLSLVIPVAQLSWWSALAKQTEVLRRFGSIMMNTLLTAGVVTVTVLICGILIGNLKRLSRSKLSAVYARIVILGYSVPASIVAVSVLVTFIAVDRSLGGLYGLLSLKKLFLTSSIVMLIFALVIRFMAIGYNNIDAGYMKMGKKYYEASKLLGKSEWQTFRYVDLPMLKPALISAAILTFVDVLKELPLTLILRPFNFDTLATRVFTYAGDEMIHEASIYALIILGISTVALLVLLRLRKENV